MKKKGTAYKKMLLSFIVVFCLPLCLMILFYFYSDHVMEKQLEISNMNLLQTIRSVCDQEIQFYQNILLKYAADTDVKEMGSKDALKGEEYALIGDMDEKLSDSIVSIAAFDNAGKDVLLYFPKIGYISSKVVGFVRTDTYFDEISIQDADTRTAILEQMDLRTQLSQEVYDTKRWGEDMVLLTKTCWQRTEECQATVGIWLNSNVLASHISSIDWDYGFDWLILDENGIVLKGTESIASPGTAFDTKAYSRGSYFVNEIGSRNTGWRYILLTPREIVQDFSGQIRIFFFVSLVLCVLIGYFVTRKIAVMNYAPLENLMKTFQHKKDQSPRKKDEYSFLQEQIATLLSSETDLQKTISRSGNTMKKWALIDLLTKPYVPQGQTGKVADMVRRFERGSNIVLLIREKITEATQTDRQDSDGLKMFIIDNVFNEKVGEAFACAMVELDGRQVLIVNDSDLPGMEEKLWEIVYDLQAVILEYFDLSITVASGGRHSGVEGIHESYLEAREAEEFIPMLEQDCITYDEIRDNTLRKYDYSTQAEDRIISAIQNNNAELAVAFIDKILDLNFKENRTTANMRRCLLLDLYCTLLKAADEKGCIDRVDVSQNSFSIEQPLQELKDKFSRLVERICVKVDQKPEIGSDKELCQRVLAYVRENYSSPNLNISQAALHFHLSPSNLSAIYKKETGRSLLKVINEVRVEYAVEFLRQGYSVVETAEKVGITESSSFIRLFKKHMGVTPGQMKIHMQKSGDQ